MTPDFLDVDDVLAIHEVQIKRFEGDAGLRDEGLLVTAATAGRVPSTGGAVLPQLSSHSFLFLFLSAPSASPPRPLRPPFKTR